jgi:fucose permease
MLRHLTTVGLLLLSLAAVVWLVICIVSASARQKRLRLAKQFFLTAIVATPVVGYLILLTVMSWPPDWVERRSQRALLKTRVEAAGG